jgi:hypothetical protein
MKGRSTLVAALVALAAAPALAFDYPTDVRADYVFGCMAANGQTQEALRRCSCSIDVISTLLTLDEYEQADTVLRMRQVRGGGEKMGMFRETAWANTLVERLKRAQIEAEVRCF